ncbi:MAG: hypothetical protein ACE5WD_09140 [Candidatus Aminicenantia bacterium]
MLEEKERKVVVFLIGLFLINSIFYFIFIRHKENDYFDSIDKYTNQRKVLQELTLKKENTRKEWLKWVHAREDIAQLRKTYFFGSREGIVEVRKELEKIARQARVNTGKIEYRYQSYEQEKIGEIDLSFSLISNYFRLKKIIKLIEEIPKFIILDKVDFVGSNPKGEVNIRLNLSAYTNEE